VLFGYSGRINLIGLARAKLFRWLVCWSRLDPTKLWWHFRLTGHILYIFWIPEKRNIAKKAYFCDNKSPLF